MFSQKQYDIDMNKCTSKILDISKYDCILTEVNFDKINTSKQIITYHNDTSIHAESTQFCTHNLISSWMSANEDKANNIFVLGKCNIVPSSEIENAHVILITNNEELTDNQIKIILKTQPLLLIATQNEHVEKYLALGFSALFLCKPWPYFYQYVKHMFNCNSESGRALLSIETSRDGVIGANLNDIDSCYIGSPFEIFETTKNYEIPTFSFPTFDSLNSALKNLTQ
jgi:hypothetical protein